MIFPLCILLSWQGLGLTLFGTLSQMSAITYICPTWFESTYIGPCLQYFGRNPGWSPMIDIQVFFAPWGSLIMTRLNLVKTWFSPNIFFIVFLTGTAFNLFNYIIKLVMEYQFNLQNPRKQKKMWIFETNKNPLFNISLGMFSKNEVKNHVL